MAGFNGEKLKDIAEFAAGKSILDSQNLSNTYLAPLTVVSHVVEIARIANDKRRDDPLLGFQAAQVFCIRFMSLPFLLL